MNSTIACPHCGQTNPGGTLFCTKCNARFPGADDAATIVEQKDSAGKAGRSVFASAAGLSDSDAALIGSTPLPPLERGTLLASGRYEILEILGQGAMGAVYKAKDRELDRLVAIKVIQPELANSRVMLKRFKQELILARQITHKNVVRIFDLGETEGMKFITMEYIDGGDLKSLIIERGILPPAEAVDIVRQICQALDAAHSEGVIHRDLKPQNIMMDHSGRVVVIDLGITHSKDLPAMTMTGALMGTPEYMSPEQAKGEKTDLRADIFAVGIIFYEMLTGKTPFKSNTVIETMYKRTRERPVPPIEIDASIPLQANQIIMKCLEPVPESRYQSVKEILQDLNLFDPEKKAGVLDRVRLHAKRRSRSLAVSAAIIVVILVVGLLLRNLQNSVAPIKTTAHTPVSVLVADFSNHTGDALFDGTLEPVVKLALEDAGFITAYDRRQMSALGLKPVAGRLDELAARQIAVSQGLGVVISGSLDSQGDSYALSLKATQAVTGNAIASVQNTSKKNQVLFSTTKLASAIRKALGDDTSDAAQRFAMETLTATSLEAIHEFAVASELVSSGKHEEALAAFSRAADIDPEFGIAYTGQAVASRNLGRMQDAEKYIKIALQKIDRMTEREKLRTRGTYYLNFGDPQRCIEEYTAMVNRFPADATAHNNIAVCAQQLRNFSRSMQEVRQAMAILPKRTLYRNNLSLFASYGSDFKTAEQEARSVQQMDPAYETGFIALAFAQAGQGQVAEAADTYRKLEKLSKAGASKAAAGLADLAIYEGRFREAADILEEAALTDLTSQFADGAASKFAALAYTRLLQGDRRAAIAAAENALQNSKIVKIQFLAGRIFAAAGQTKRAQELADGLASKLDGPSQAYAKIIAGEIALQKGDPRRAIKVLVEANTNANFWIGHFVLGRAYLEAGAFPDADSEFDLCLKRRGEALALFVDESPTFAYFPATVYSLGRSREGLKSAGFGEFYKKYLSIREKAGEDLLIPEIRKRLK